jgi:hypothetical protein
MSSEPTEEQAGAVRCLDGAVYVYRSGERDRWARLCMVAEPSSLASSGRADVLLSLGQAAGVAGAMEKEDPKFMCVAKKGVLWCGQSRSAAGTVLGAECAFGNGPKEVRATSGHLRQIAAALLAASASPDPLDGARRRTDDNLRRAFGWRNAERKQ